MSPSFEKGTPSPAETEKEVAIPSATLVQDERYDAEHGYVLDADRVVDGAQTLKTAKDGHTILIPQPTENPDDPLNWSWKKKYMFLFVISTVSFLSDYGSSMGAGMLTAQAEQWHLPINVVQHSTVGNLICLGAGGLVAVALSEYFGRLPVIFYFQIMAFVTSIWNAVAVGFSSYLASRIVNGFFAIVAQAGGLMWIKDLFFFHEHPQTINLFTGGVIIAPYLGPLTAAFLTAGATWRWSFWVYTILNGIALLMIIFLLDETYFDRRTPAALQPARRSRWKRLLGIEKIPRNPFGQSILRPFVAFSKIPVACITIYYFLVFAWIIGVNATISVWLIEFYHFTSYGVGLFYFSPIIGTIIGEVLGHWLHDMVGNFYRRRHGRIDPEVRLLLCYPGTLLMGVGIIVVGYALQNTWSYMVVAVLWAIDIVGNMVATTAINAYLLDAYPEGSGEVCAWINVGRTFGGMMATYVIFEWVDAAGSGTALGIMAGITWAAALLPLFLQIFGKRIRQWQGPMKFPGE